MSEPKETENLAVSTYMAEKTAELEKLREHAQKRVDFTYKQLQQAEEHFHFAQLEYARARTVLNNVGDLAFELSTSRLMKFSLPEE